MIYFDNYKNAYAYEIEDFIASIEDDVWQKYAGTDKWDIINNKFVDISETPEYLEKLAQSKQQTFEKEFFSTSLGYIRRKVSMASGDTKDFLSDLLPAISAGVQMGQQIPIITYNIPDFTKDFSIEYMESLQEIKFAAAEFVQECFLQLSKDFAPVPLVINEGE